MPLISVIVPVFKVEQYLNKCVNSILSQSFTNYEIILVDDGSPDNCGMLCDQYAAKYSNIIALHRENGGLSAARNTGIEWAFKYSNSMWLAFVDSDDYLYPDYLLELYQKCIIEDADICMCDFTRFDENGISVETVHDFPECVCRDKDGMFEILYSNWRTVVAWNKLYRKTLFEEIRYDVGRIHEDEFIIHRLLEKCNTVTYLSKPLYCYVIRSGSIMTSEKDISNKLINIEIVISRHMFCRQHGLPVNQKVMNVDYMRYVLSLKREINKDNKDYYHKLRNAYKRIYLKEVRRPFIQRILFNYYMFIS